MARRPSCPESALPGVNMFMTKFFIFFLLRRWPCKEALLLMDTPFIGVSISS